MNDETRSLIGAKLKEAREYLSISQDEAAKAASIPRSAVSLIESGQRKLDTVELMHLAKLYQRPMAYFTSDNFSIEIDEAVAVLARNFTELSENDRNELLKFAEFLSMKSRQGE